jgi:hypothetical protein
MAAPSSEADFARGILSALEPHFRIHTEVKGLHPTGKRLRIDAIAVPLDPSPWARPDIALGIEFKAPTDRPNDKRDRKDNAKIISQCIDYSLVLWERFGQVPIFFSPGFEEVRIAHASTHKRETFQQGFDHGLGFLMAGVMGQNNIGELVTCPFLGLAFLINGHHRIWSERSGLGEGRYNKLIRSVGSR